MRNYLVALLFLIFSTPSLAGETLCEQYAQCLGGVVVFHPIKICQVKVSRYPCKADEFCTMFATTSSDEILSKLLVKCQQDKKVVNEFHR